MSAAEVRSQFDVALVFSTKYELPHPLLNRWPAWERLKTRLFGYHRDLPPAAAAQLLDGRIVFTEARHGLWIAVIEIERVEEAGVELDNESFHGKINFHHRDTEKPIHFFGFPLCLCGE
jgi:hypothetical protein